MATPPHSIGIEMIPLKGLVRAPESSTSTRRYPQQLDGLPPPLRAHVGVDLGGGQRLVPEQRLDHAQIRAAVQQLGGEGVAEQVRVQAAADAAAHALAEEHDHLLGDAPPPAHEEGMPGGEVAASD